mgnify:CR=1 FL=1
MKSAKISGYLIFVWMIMLLHNAIPHWHLEDFLAHDHIFHCAGQKSHSHDFPKPSDCLIHSAHYDLPKGTAHLKPVFSDQIDTGFLAQVLLIPENPQPTRVSFQQPPGDALKEGFPLPLAARAPPC